MSLRFIHHRDLQWEKVNWKKQSTTEIARAMGVSLSRVSVMRRKLAPETLRDWNPARWQDVDWSRPVSEIAREMGVSKQLVSITRKRHGK